MSSTPSTSSDGGDKAVVHLDEDVAISTPTPSKPYFGMMGFWLNFWVTVACTTAMMLFGYDQGVFGGIIVTEDFLQTMGNPDSTLQGTIVSLYDIGCFAGAIATMMFGERLGRRKSFTIGIVVMSIGAILQITAFGVPHMIVGRLVTGFGNGINTSISPVWQSETCKAAWRGKLIILAMILNVFGFSLSNWMTYGFSFIHGSISWRFPIAFQLVFSIILISTVPWLPESPRWLLAHGREDDGVAILCALDGCDTKPTDLHIINQKQAIMEAVRAEQDNAPSWSDILRGKTGETGTVKRLILGAGTQWFQQLVGINVTSYYLPLVLQDSVGLSNNLARLLAACNSVSYLIFSFLGLILIERAGRRKMLMIGAAAQCACYAVITGLLSQADGSSRGSQFGAAATAFFFLYYVSFGICYQGIPWLYPVEINSLAMRTKGAALGSGSNWISNFLVVQITPIGISNLGWRFYIIWVVLNAAIIPVCGLSVHENSTYLTRFAQTVYFFYPETANRQLEDMDRLYRENKNLVFVPRNKEAIQTSRPQRYIDAEEERSYAIAHDRVPESDPRVAGREATKRQNRAEIGHKEYL
ncbi:hypothetical protein VNI00_006113 [Paramarasmius palmivorus]|uniref:Major facilitator superfamily (MFS) profile domain-containing protein n=1 Tax=Paramarasmius palmivorus TaxID=297713 RepID=A0AAW0D925_9AGAR